MKELTYTAAAREALDEEMARDPRIFVMGEGIGKRGGNFNTTLGLYEKYGPTRLCDTPIAERGFVGLAVGAAMSGSRPIIDFMFVDFILDAMGEIINQMAKMQYMSSGRLTMPVILRGCIGIGGAAATHHSGSYYSLFSNIPGLRVIVPTTPADVKGLFRTALRGNDPVIMLEHKNLLNGKGMVPEDDYTIPFGSARVAREGRHLTALGVALSVSKCQQAADVLAREGIEVEVIDPRTTSPLDTDTILASIKKTGRLLIVDDAFGPCGLGAEVSAMVAEHGFDDLDAPIRRLNGAFAPTPYSPTLEKVIVPDVERITTAMRDLVKE